MHFDELRILINVLRQRAGLPPFDFGTEYPGFVKASHLLAMRTALAEARQALGMAAPVFTDAVGPGTTIKAIHIQELREQAR